MPLATPPPVTSTLPVTLLNVTDFHYSPCFQNHCSNISRIISQMNNLLTLSVILLGISLVRVDCQPAPPVTELYFDSNVYKEPNGYTKFYYSQKGYSERVYVNFNGAEVILTL